MYFFTVCFLLGYEFRVFHFFFLERIVCFLNYNNLAKKKKFETHECIYWRSILFIKFAQQFGSNRRTWHWYTKNVKRLKRWRLFNLSIKTGLLATGYSVLEVIWWRGDGMVFTFTALGGAWIVRAWWKCAFVVLSAIIQTNASVYRFVVTARVIGRWVVLFYWTSDLNEPPDHLPTLSATN